MYIFRPKERITILLGAGAIVEQTGASTSYLTRKVIEGCRKCRPVKNGISLINELCRGFLSIYFRECRELLREKICINDIDAICRVISFEDIFHALELLAGSVSHSGHKGYISPHMLFSRLLPSFKDIDILPTARELIDIINDEVYAYDCQFSTMGQDFMKFFTEIQDDGKFLLDVFNLNYDTWVEQTLQNYNDGYITIQGYEGKMQRFDVNTYLDYRQCHTVSHLHGQINFEYPDFRPSDINRYVTLEDTSTLYKYLDFNTAKSYRHRSARSDEHSQAGENIFRTNIVTGLMKTDKLLWSPLSIYHSRLADALMNNSRLLIIGYGFVDLYINALLTQYIARHSGNIRAVVIDYVHEDNWTPQIEHPLSPHDKAIFLARLFGGDSWWMRELRPKPYYEVKNVKARFYREGFRKVIENYIPDIIKLFFSRDFSAEIHGG